MPKSKPPAISPEDQAWIDRLPAYLRSTATEHGRALFEFVLNLATATEALSEITHDLRATTHLQRIAVHLNRLAQSLNILAGLTAQERGWTDSDIARCRLDLDRAISLSGQADKPAIIVPTRH